MKSSNVAQEDMFQSWFHKKKKKQKQPQIESQQELTLSLKKKKKIFFSFNLLNEKIFWKKKNLSLNGNDPISVEINLKIVKK